MINSLESKSFDLPLTFHLNHQSIVNITPSIGREARESTINAKSSHKGSNFLLIKYFQAKYISQNLKLLNREFK